MDRDTLRKLTEPKEGYAEKWDRIAPESPRFDIEKQEKLTSALWGFAWELQNEPLTITAGDGTRMNPESMRRAQEVIMRLFGYEVREIQ